MAIIIISGQQFANVGPNAANWATVSGRENNDPPFTIEGMSRKAALRRGTVSRVFLKKWTGIQGMYQVVGSYSEFQARKYKPMKLAREAEGKRWEFLLLKAQTVS